MSDPEEESYEVEEIQDKRKVVGGGWLFYVKWVGWPSNSNTWEPPEHLETCYHLVEEFERKIARKAERKAERKEERMREDKIKIEKKHQRRRQTEVDNISRLKTSTIDETEGKGCRNEKDHNHNDDEEKNGNVKNKEEKENTSERPCRKKFSHPKILSSDSSDDEPVKKVDLKKDGNKMCAEIPSRIIGVTQELSEVFFYVEYKTKGGEDNRSTELVSAEEAYEKIPQMCLEFYEENLVWNQKSSVMRGVGS